ncbi:ABC transporter substrate-binding protein [Xylophilus sp. ASV27]|uniref:ABC transporter substrate-binding protein n=1 Tax=Xylophilus sp. ASV27 TaxID=2795129 RepID=UPI0018EE1AFB|nr:ABC transporter substrate-binding protein [Xylophilus sp. ASV27]
MKTSTSWLSPRSFACIAILVMVVFSASTQARTVKDVAGRSVVVPDRVERILLGEGRLVYTLALLEGKQVFDRLVGWQGDFRGLDVQGYAAFAKVFPQAEKVPLVGGTSSETFSVEKALSVRPDVAFMAVSGGHGPTPDSEAVRQLQAAGVPVVFVDFSNHPLRNTVPSLRIMGEVLRRSQQAEAYIAFYEQQLRSVTDRVNGAASKPGFKRPSIFIDMLAGLQDCCGSPGKGNFGEMVDIAGGENIGAGRIPGPIGKLNLEYILSRNPDVYVATGVFAAGQAGVTLGYQASSKDAESSLRAVAQRPETRELGAVKAGRVHGLWHIFYDSPEHIIAVQALAKWLHPELFADLDPRRTRAELYRRFMPIPEQGVLFTDTTP